MQVLENAIMKISKLKLKRRYKIIQKITTAVSLIQSSSFGTPGGIRTPDKQIRSLPLYPAELQAHKKSLNTITHFLIKVNYLFNRKILRL